MCAASDAEAARPFDALAFERLITDISATFVEAKATETDDLIEGSLQAVVEALDLDRSSLSQFSKTGRKLVLTHSWSLPGVESVQGFVVEKEAPVARMRIDSGEGFHFSDPSELPEELAPIAKWFHNRGVTSHATIPLVVGSHKLGGFHVASLRRRIDWAPLLPRLRLLARIFGSALERQRVELQLRQAFRKVEKLKGELERDNILLREQLRSAESGEHLVGDSPAIHHALVKAAQVAPTDSTVLLLGETGTGKGLLARKIHQHSSRSDHSLIEIDCTLLPPTLIDSELFGHEKGAFSGADRSKPGRLEMADRGTLFLDEIGELSPDLQKKLLRVLETGKISRLGSTETRRVDVRLIAATNRNLEAESQRGSFRKDLYYRINIFPIVLPTLRERREDIKLLAWHFVEQLQHKLGKRIEEISQRSVTALHEYDWPGNVRELRNVIERSIILTRGSCLEVELPVSGRGAHETASGKAEDLESLEREHILRVLDSCRGRIKGPTGAAERLGLKPSTLYYRLKKLGIERPKPRVQR